MIWLRTWQLGVKSLFLHPMRSLLTVLGIFIGVASVIALLAIGEGISRKAEKEIEALGATNIMIRSIKPPDKGVSGVSDVKAFGLTRAEKRQIEQTMDNMIELSIPIREMPMQFSYTGNPNLLPIAGRLVGCSPEYPEVVGIEMARGHFFTDVEAEKNAPICILSAQLADKLFPLESPISKQLYIPEKKEYYRIIGVTKPKEATAAIGGSLSAQDFSTDVYIPIQTMRKRYGDRNVKRSGGSFSVKIFELSQLTLKIKSVDDVPKTAELIKATLTKNDTEQRDDIAVIVPYELLEQAKRTKAMIMIAFGLVAAISLVVGGIGIMNIMLATVTERTREIGIRRALGAKRSSIIYQFLVETIVLSAAGGVTGILFGVLCPWIITGIKHAMNAAAPDLYQTIPTSIIEMEPTIVPESIPIAFCISVVVGVIFGVYPAYRAAQMDPIQALRHE